MKQISDPGGQAMLGFIVRNDRITSEQILFWLPLVIVLRLSSQQMKK